MEAEPLPILSEYPDRAPELRRHIGDLFRMGLLSTATGQVEERDYGFPKRLGDFVRGRRLGGGGMGVVFEARQESLGRDVALKMIRPDRLHLELARRRFQTEVETIAQLKHPGIVPVYSVGKEAGIPFFAMELVDGCTLEEVIWRLSGQRVWKLRGRDLQRAILEVTGKEAADATELPELFQGRWETTCLRVIRQVALALGHAHAQDVLHRDLKPSNILITADGPVLRTRRWCQRHPAATVTLVLGTLLLGGGPTALWLQPRRANEVIAAQKDRAESNLATAMDAVGFYEGLLAAEQQDPVLRRSLAEAQRNLSWLYMKLGKLEKAMDSARLAAETVDQLLEVSPGDAALLELKSLCQQNLGALYRRAQKIAEAEQALKLAISGCEQILDAPGRQRMALVGLGVANRELGSLYGRQARLEELAMLEKRAGNLLPPTSVLPIARSPTPGTAPA